MISVLVSRCGYIHVCVEGDLGKSVVCILCTNLESLLESTSWSLSLCACKAISLSMLSTQNASYIYLKIYQMNLV